MTLPRKPPYLDEINARIAEAKEWGNQPEVEFATWQKRFIERQAEARRRGKNVRDRAGEGKRNRRCKINYLINQL